jgi:protein involved in polysaccharide export with SLBB domain
MNDQIVTPEERQYYDLEAHLRRGTVAVDFVRLFEKNDKSQDVLLVDEDVINIPNSLKTIYVYGQVAKPGFVAYQQGADVRYYISQAGGFGEEAESGKIRVIKGKTREWVHPSDTTIEPGDYIWVPKDIKYPFSYYMNIASQAASLVSVVLSMTLIVLQLTQK